MPQDTFDLTIALERINDFKGLSLSENQTNWKELFALF
jgi:hypothetical protein